MRRKTFQLLLVVVLAASALGAQQQTRSASAPEKKRLREHVEYLASADLEGRRTGTKGAAAAAEYIAKEFERYGLRDGGYSAALRGKERPRGYMQSFPYVAGVELGKGNAMTFRPQANRINIDGRDMTPGLDLRVGEDWMPLAWSANARVESSPVTYVGYGIAAAELQHDDYAGVDLRGRIALAFAGTPDGDNPHGSFARFADLRFKAAAARDRGARALLVIAREDNFKDDKLARLRVDESVASGDAGIPVVVISRQAARRAFAAAATPTLRFEELENALPRTAPPGGTRGSSETAQHAAPAAPTTVRNFSAPLRDIAFTVATKIVRREAPAVNVVGILEGSDPELKNEAVVIGAHYDHLGRGGQGSLAAREGEIHHGADDNASGVAGLLELARTFAEDRKSLRRTIVFIAFGGEEEGLLGSSYYVRNPVVPLAQTVAMINLDMIGRLKENRLNVGGVGTSSEWKKWIESANHDLKPEVTATGASASASREGAARSSVPVVVAANGETIVRANPGERFALTLTEDGFGPSDHASFYAKQTPVLFFWTGTHEDYHKPSDTADRVNYQGEQRIVSFVSSIVRALDANDKRPTYTLARSDAAAGRSTGFRVYLGTIPNYAETTGGMKLDAVREDSPAAKAGLRAGDVIVRLAQRDVRNVYDYTYALGEMKAGVEYEVEVLRGAERLKFKLTPTARK